jgi:tetratricopeptide (TPR) repeat protein
VSTTPLAVPQPATSHAAAENTWDSKPERAPLASIPTALEALAGNRVAEQVERLAHHALRGEMWDKALARSAYREAVRSFEQALSALSHLPETRDTWEQAIDLRLAKRTALRALGEAERLLTRLREAETLAEHLTDPRRLAQVALYLSNHASLLGAHDQAIAAAQREPPESAQAEAYYHQALALAEALGMRPLMAHCHHGLGTLYATLSQRAQARTALTIAIEMYRAMDMPFWLLQAKAALAQVEDSG